MNQEVLQGLELRIQKLNLKLEGLEPGSAEHQRCATDLAKLLERYNALIHDEYEYFAKQESRELEREKLKAQAEADADARAVERERIQAQRFDTIQKTKTRPVEVAKDVALAVVPAVITIAAYDRFQKRNLEFEQTGRLTTDTARQLRLPNLPFFRR